MKKEGSIQSGSQKTSNGGCPALTEASVLSMVEYPKDVMSSPLDVTIRTKLDLADTQPLMADRAILNTMHKGFNVVPVPSGGVLSGGVPSGGVPSGGVLNEGVLSGGVLCGGVLYGGVPSYVVGNTRKTYFAPSSVVKDVFGLSFAAVPDPFAKPSSSSKTAHSNRVGRVGIEGRVGEWGVGESGESGRVGRVGRVGIVGEWGM